MNTSTSNPFAFIIIARKWIIFYAQTNENQARTIAIFHPEIGSAENHALSISG